MKEFGLRIGLSKIDAFEGWFCKIDDWKNELMLSVIWGYSTHKKTKHAFIQFQDTLSHGTSYISYPLDELKWKADPFVLQIGNNVLSESGMHLDFELKGVPVRGDFTFSNLMPIKKHFLNPTSWDFYLTYPINAIMQLSV